MASKSSNTQLCQLQRHTRLHSMTYSTRDHQGVTHRQPRSKRPQSRFRTLVAPPFQRPVLRETSASLRRRIFPQSPPPHLLKKPNDPSPIFGHFPPHPSNAGSPRDLRFSPPLRRKSF